LRLLCLANVGKLHEAIDLLINNFKHVARDFARHYFKEPAQWGLLLQRVLDGVPQHPDYNELYASLLDHLSTQYEIEIFLKLLPPNGNIAFFLPFIEKALNSSRARQLKGIIETEEKALSADQLSN